MVFSADYLRNVGTHSLLGIDINHDGDVKNFNLANAQAAINATNGKFGCPAGPGAGVDCAILAGATMADYGNNGLASASDFGQACVNAIGVPCAFPGKNPGQPDARSAGMLAKFLSSWFGIVLVFSSRVRRKYSSFGRAPSSSGLYSSMAFIASLVGTTEAAPNGFRSPSGHQQAPLPPVVNGN